VAPPGAYFGIAAADLPETMAPLAERMQDAPAQWRAIAQQHGLAEADIGRLASWWHTDADLGRPMEVMTDMGKSRKGGLPRLPGHARGFLQSVRKAEGGAHHSALTPLPALPAADAPATGLAFPAPAATPGPGGRRGTAAGVPATSVT
jgi:hypothetical protein